MVTQECAVLEPAPPNGQSYFSGIPAAFELRAGECLLVPMHHIFGSDELSLSAPGIAAVAPKPHVAVMPVISKKVRKSR